MLYIIAYLGPKATFSDLAVSNLFPNEVKKPMPTIPDCLDAVRDGRVDLAVIPIENALEGSVNITMDYLIHEVRLPITGEIVTPIEQHYLIHPNHDPLTFKPEIVYSHSHAIAQCRKFLHNDLNGVSSEYVTSTAAAAKMVLENPNKPIAAIANEMAAKQYGLTIAKRDVHDYSHNHTKFIVVSRGDESVEYKTSKVVEHGYKTTLMVTLPMDQSGVLHQVLSAFAWRKLNLSKIESRPMKTGLGNYFFIIDIEMKMDEVLIPGAIAELEAIGCSTEVLGSYPSFSTKQQNQE